MKISGAYGGALNNILSDKKKNMEQLSSGKKLNRASDDVAGLGISERLESQTNEFATKTRALQNKISFFQSGDTGLKSVNSNLTQLKELSVQYKNDTLSSSDKEIIQNQANEIVSSIDDVLKNTEFNTKKVLSDMSIEDLGLKDFSLDDDSIMNVIDNASKQISEKRSEFSAETNRLESEVKRLQVASENSLAANSRIEDADMLLSIMNKTKGEILEEANMAVNAQSQFSQQRILDILKD